MVVEGGALAGRRGGRELPVERGELRAAARRGLQVRRVVAAEAVAAGQRGDLAIVLIAVCRERQQADGLHVTFGCTRFNASVPFLAQQYAAYFMPEQIRHDGFFDRDPLNDSVGKGRSVLVPQTPGDGDGCVDHDGHQALPSSRA